MRISPLVSIRTLWISEASAREDFTGFFQDFGDVSSDTLVDFAIHSLGWIRATVAGGFVEAVFDIRIVRDATLENLAEFVQECGSAAAGVEHSTLFRVELFTGRSWQAQTSTNADDFMRMIFQIAEFVQPPQTPSTVESSDLNAGRLEALDNERIRTLYRTWSRDPSDLASIGAVVGDGLADAQVRVLVPHGSGFIVADGLQAIAGGLHAGATVPARHRQLAEAIPDPALVREIEQLAAKALESGGARLQHCRGPIRTGSRAARLCDWNRVALPVGHPAGGFRAVLMVTWENPQQRSVRSRNGAGPSGAGGLPGAGNGTGSPCGLA